MKREATILICKSEAQYKLNVCICGNRALRWLSRRFLKLWKWKKNNSTQLYKSDIYTFWHPWRPPKITLLQNTPCRITHLDKALNLFCFVYFLLLLFSFFTFIGVFINKTYKILGKIYSPSSLSLRNEWVRHVSRVLGRERSQYHLFLVPSSGIVIQPHVAQEGHTSCLLHWKGVASWNHCLQAFPREKHGWVS